MLMVGWYDASLSNFLPKLECFEFFGVPRTNDELDALRKVIKEKNPWTVPEVYSVKEIGE